VTCRQINARYNPHFLPNAAKILQITLYQHWLQSNPIELYFLLFWYQYTIERISADIGDMSTIQSALYCTFTAKFSLNPPDYANSTLIPVKSNIITVLLLQAQYSIERISAAIGCLSTNRRALYSTFEDKYRAHQQVCAMSILELIEIQCYSRFAY
jgi:hypothetical protein